MQFLAYILVDSDSPPPLSLPDQWLWDIIDEFIYQFQSFSVWRSRVRQKSEEEIQLLAEGGQVGCVATYCKEVVASNVHDLGVVMLLSTQRAILFHSKVQNKRAHRRYPTWCKSGGDRVSSFKFILSSCLNPFSGV